MIYRSVSEVDFRLEDLPALPRPGRVLFASPDFFDVRYVINPHMAPHVGTVNRSEAARQWQSLQEAYETLGFQPSVVRGAEDLPDMVFCANQTLPFYRPGDGTRGVVLSQMHAPERRDEVPHFARFFRQNGYEVVQLPAGLQTDLEGMGDAIWHPSRYLLWGGYGFRTDAAAYEHLSETLNVSVLVLELQDPDFYHLDTCFSALDEQSVLVYPGAFQAEGEALVRHFFPRVIEAPEEEARRLFACNAHCPDGRHVLIQRGAEETCRRLQEAGYTPVEMETDEFLKAGGSVFCMKQMFW